MFAHNSLYSNSYLLISLQSKVMHSSPIKMSSIKMMACPPPLTSSSNEQQFNQTLWETLNDPLAVLLSSPPSLLDSVPTPPSTEDCTAGDLKNNEAPKSCLWDSIQDDTPSEVLPPTVKEQNSSARRSRTKSAHSRHSSLPFSLDSVFQQRPTPFDAKVKKQVRFVEPPKRGKEQKYITALDLASPPSRPKRKASPLRSGCPPPLELSETFSSKLEESPMIEKVSVPTSSSTGDCTTGDLKNEESPKNYLWDSLLDDAPREVLPPTVKEQNPSARRGRTKSSHSRHSSLPFSLDSVFQQRPTPLDAKVKKQVRFVEPPKRSKVHKYITALDLASPPSRPKRRTSIGSEMEMLSKNSNELLRSGSPRPQELSSKDAIGSKQEESPMIESVSVLTSPSTEDCAVGALKTEEPPKSSLWDSLLEDALSDVSTPTVKEQNSSARRRRKKSSHSRHSSLPFSLDSGFQQRPTPLHAPSDVSPSTVKEQNSTSRRRQTKSSHSRHSSLPFSLNFLKSMTLPLESPDTPRSSRCCETSSKVSNEANQTFFATRI
jgi:hypothetical protein